jgi:short-subunit dehydrogenase
MEIARMSVLVTGATGGLGQAIARELAGRGASVILTGRRADVLEPLAIELGGRAIVADLTDRAAAAALMDESGPVDILVANAGLPASGSLTDFALDAVDRALDVNLRAPVVLARLAAEEMVSRRRGHLVFMGSVGGKVSSGGASLYNATKFGLRGFSLALRQELRPHGVGVSAIHPGFIRDAGMYAEANVPLPRGLGTHTSSEVARAVSRAIERDLAEVDVAPLSLRMGAKFAAVAPGLAARVQRLGGGDRLTQALAEGQRDKR